MEEISGKYSENEVKFNQLSNMFSHISNASFYSTHVKIAAKEYVKFMNEINSIGDNKVIVQNTGVNSGGTFAIKIGDKFIVNEKLIKKSINQAHNDNLYKTFGFFKVNIVLDKLKDTLLARN
jgi:hypothetical protein